MKQKHTSKKEDAVSPIVGVMLMLVATIVVAAVVAAFAGGIAGDTEASPNVIITGTYSQTDGLMIKHTSGDSLSGVDIYVRPDEGFSSANYKYSWKVKSISESSVWNAGEAQYVEANKIQPYTAGAPDSQYNSTSTKYPVAELQLEVNSGGKTYNTTKTTAGTQSNHDGRSSGFGFNHPNNVGKTMIVELHKDGRIIASTPVKIMA